MSCFALGYRLVCKWSFFLALSLALLMISPIEGKAENGPSDEQLWNAYYSYLQAELSTGSKPIDYEALRNRHPLLAGRMIQFGAYTFDIHSSKWVKNTQLVDRTIMVPEVVTVTKTGTVTVTDTITNITRETGVITYDPITNTTSGFQNWQDLPANMQPGHGRGKSVWLAEGKVGYKKSWQWHRAEFLRLENPSLTIDQAMARARMDWAACEPNARCGAGTMFITGTNNIQTPVELNPSLPTTTSSRTTTFVPSGLTPEVTTNADGSVTTINFGDKKVTYNTVTTVVEVEGERLYTLTSNRKDGRVLLVNGEYVTEVTTEYGEVPFESVTEKTETVTRTEEYTYEEDEVREREKTVTEEEVTYEKKKQKEWEFDVGPILFGDFYHEEQAINLGPHDGEADLGQDFPKLQIQREEDDQFRVTRLRGWDAGIGVAVNIINRALDEAIRGAGFSVGLALLKGKTVRSERLVDSRTDLIQTPGLGIPKDLSDIQDWRISETASWSTRGGILFNLGVGVPGLSIGTPIFAVGSWNYEVTKVSDNFVFVRVSEADVETIKSLKNVSLNVFTLVTLASSFMDYVEEGFAYRFDLRNEKAAEAYRQVLAGNLSPADLYEFSARELQGGVLPVAKVRNTAVNRVRSFTIGLPIMGGFTSGKGAITGNQRTEFHKDGSKSDVNYGAYVVNNSTRAWGTLYYQKSYGFYGRSHTHRTNDGQVNQGYFGEMTFSTTTITDEALTDERPNEHGAKASGYRLQMFINDLIRKTGLRENLYVEAPADEDLGYVGVHFKMHISQQATDRLMEIANQDPKAFERKALQYATEYFESGTDPYHFCDDFGSAETYRDCENQMKLRIKDGLFGWDAGDDMGRYLKQMHGMANRSTKEFAVAYAKFGRAMLLSPFLVRAMINLLDGEGVFGNYEINGRDIRRYTGDERNPVIRFVADWDPGTLKKAGFHVAPEVLGAPTGGGIDLGAIVNEPVAAGSKVIFLGAVRSDKHIEFSLGTYQHYQPIFGKLGLKVSGFERRGRKEFYVGPIPGGAANAAEICAEIQSIARRELGAPAICEVRDGFPANATRMELR